MMQGERFIAITARPWMDQDKEQACHNSSNPSVAVSAVIPGRKIKKYYADGREQA